METPPDDNLLLRRTLRDLVALTTLPTLWAGKSPAEIGESLSDVLLTILSLDLVYILFDRLPDGTPIEIVRTEGRLIVGEQAHTIGKSFTSFLHEKDSPVFSTVHPLAGGLLRVAVIPIGANGTDGFVIAGSKSAYALTELDRLLLGVAANQAVSALQQAHLVAQLRTGQRQIAFLAEASAALVSSLDYTITLSQVAHLAVPTMADWCSVHLLNPDGSVTQIAVAHTDPTQIVKAEVWRQRYPDNADLSGGLLQAIRTGKVALYPEISEPVLAEIAQDEEELRWLRGASLTSAMIVPIIARGKVLGTIRFISAESRRIYKEADLALAEDVAGRAAAAIDNALLYREATEQRGNLQVTLSSIGDAVIATDVQGYITFLNPVAQSLTGWSQTEAVGKLLDTVFNILNETTHQSVENPVMKALQQGKVVGLANHTVLIAKNGLEIAIDDSAAPIRNDSGTITGVILVFRDVSERRQKQRLHAHLAAIVESADDAIIGKDLNAIITSWNKGAEQMYGYTAQEAIGKPISIIVPVNFTDDISIILEQIKQGKRVEHYETKRMRKDGAVLDVSLTVSPIYDDDGHIIGASKIAHDITERKQIERHVASLHEQIREAAARSARLQIVTAALSSAATTIEVARVLLNQGTEAVGAVAASIAVLQDDNTLSVIGTTGYSDEELQPWRKFSLDTPVPVAEVVRTGSAIWIESQDAWNARYPSIQPSTPQHQAWAVLPLIIKGRILGAIGFNFAQPHVFSIEERAFILILAEQSAQALDRARLYEVEAKARQLAEEANALKVKFLGMISHELRTPLTSIKGFASSLLANDVTFLPEEERQFMSIINEEADKLTSLVNQLLDLSRLQSGTLRIEPTPQPLRTIFKHVMPQLQTLSVQHQLNIQIPVDLPEVLVDVERIAQVLANLVGNAAKFSPIGTPITIQVFQEHQYVQIDVNDLGVGIPLEEREIVFEAFRQVERKHPGQRQGAGLGLAICKSIVEAHNGRIWIQDQALGTTFSFLLPTVSTNRT